MFINQWPLSFFSYNEKGSSGGPAISYDDIM